MKHRVVVTGVGVVASNGLRKEAFWQALKSGLSGVRSIRRFDSSLLPTRIAGEIVDLNPLDYFDPHELKKVDRSNVLAVAASQEALADAGLDLRTENMERMGSSLGNAVCGIEYAQNESDVIHTKGPRWGSPYLAIAFFPCGSNGLLSIRFGMKGPVLTFCNGNTSGSDAIGMAYRLIRGGKADVMVAGGTEAPLIPLFVGSLAQDGWLSRHNDAPEKACRPFDRKADGMVLGEGSGVIILEEYDHARARGAHIYAELAGYASVNSAFDVYKPEPNGMGIVRTMRDVLCEEGLTPTDVDWVNAQGFSLLDYDRMESRCIGEVFLPGERPGPWVSAVSSWIGNSIGALGGIQAVASALALDRQMIPPQNVDDVDTTYPVRQMIREAIQQPLRVVLQNAYCFMGKNSTLLFKKVEKTAV